MNAAQLFRDYDPEDIYLALSDGGTNPYVPPVEGKRNGVTLREFVFAMRPEEVGRLAYRIEAARDFVSEYLGSE